MGPIQFHQQHGLVAAQAQTAVHDRQGEVVAQLQGDQVGMGVARLIGGNVRPQVQVVVGVGPVGGR